METKESLLKLINTCVDNKQFYSQNNKECIESYASLSKRHRYLDKVFYETVNRIFYLANSTEDHRKIYDSDELTVKISGLENSKYTKTCELYSGLYITFEDTPSINIRVKGDDTITEISEFLINEIEYKLKKSWKFWKEGEGIKIPTGKKILFKVKETKTEYCYEITSGSINENISIEEFEKIMEKYKENKVKFARLIDEEKIQERLEKYKI